MDFFIREINKTDSEELALVRRRCMATVLETCPEFEGREDLAQKALGNFSFPQMAEMIQNGFADPQKRVMVAIYDSSIVGHSIYSIKLDAECKAFGFFFSRYVEPKYRRKGIANMLMRDAMEWFTKKGVAYMIGHTHVTNIPLQNLFTKFGFRMEGPLQDRWSYYLLRKDV